MTDRSFGPELNDVLVVIHGDVVQATSPEAFTEAFWSILESESKSARLLSLVHALQLKRDDTDREAIIARAEKDGLTGLPVEDLSAISTDEELCKTVLTRIYPDILTNQVEQTRIKAMMLVDRKGRKYTAEMRPAVSPDGRFGWILEATGVPAGALEVEVMESGTPTTRPRRVASFNIPAALTDVAFTAGALAGKSESDEGFRDPCSTYDHFAEVRDKVDSNQHLEGDLEGYIIPQQRGARVAVFVPQSIFSTMNKSQ